MSNILLISVSLDDQHMNQGSPSHCKLLVKLLARYLVLQIELSSVSERVEPFLIKLVWRLGARRFVPEKPANFVTQIQNDFLWASGYFYLNNLNIFIIGKVQIKVHIWKLSNKTNIPACPSQCQNHTPHSRNIFA